MYSIFILLSFISSSLQAATSSAVYYNYADFKSGTEYTPRTINTTKYNSSDNDGPNCVSLYGQCEQPRQLWKCHPR